MMPLIEDARALRGRTLLDRDAQEVGKVKEVYLDEETRWPEWVSVKTGMLGGSALVPITGALEEAGDLRVQFSQSQISDAPRVSADQDLSQQEEAALYRHYGLNYSESKSDTGLPEGGGLSAGGEGLGRDEAGAKRGGVGRGGSAASADVETQPTASPEADDAMTLSEERLQPRVERQPVGRIRLRKWVETETETATVPVQRETARIQREPITDANVDRAVAGPEISEAEHEITLEEEAPVIEKEVVPKERVRLDKEVVTEEEQVSGEVRRERVDVDDDSGRMA